MSTLVLRNVGGRAMEDEYFRALKAKRDPALESLKKAVMQSASDFNSVSKSELRVKIGANDENGIRVFSADLSSELRQAWIIRYGVDKIQISLRDCEIGDCGQLTYLGSLRHDSVLVAVDKTEIEIDLAAKRLVGWLAGESLELRLSSNNGRP